MHELEDEPEDVQNATPVEDEVKQGENDELSTKVVESSTNTPEPDKHHRCRKQKPAIQKVDCCEEKRRRKAAEKNRKVTMYVHEEPCKLVKPEIIPRHCMSKEEYLDFLAAPSKKCEDSCELKPVKRRFRALSPRIEELAKPTKRRLFYTLQERANMLSPETLNNLIEILEAETALTPEQAETLVQDKELSKTKKKSSSRSKCRASKMKQLLGAGDQSLDVEAAKTHYCMAVRFVRSIFNWQCLTPRSEYRDISECILHKLSIHLEYNPVGNEDKKSQQMRLLADVFACWISQILMEVAEKHRKELEEECWRRKQEAEDLATREELEAQEEESASLGGQDEEEEEEEEEDDEDKLAAAVASMAQTLCTATQTAAAELAAAASCHTQYEDGDLGDECEEDDEDLMASSCADDSHQSTRSEEGSLGLGECDGRTDSCVQTEDGKTDAETEIGPDPSEISAVKSSHEVELERLASKMCATLQTDVPFVTFAKIFDTLYTMILCEQENTLRDPLDNRIHRAIYEKFECIMKEQEPELFNERMKDVVDVTTGKIAKWFRRTLNRQQIKFLDENPAQVESREVRDWSKWLVNVAEVAEDWSEWINKMTCEMTAMKEEGKMTRGAWQDWTRKFEANALLWRRTHLEAIHQEHHNTMMLCDREVTKTGTKRRPQFSEVAIKKTNFDESASRSTRH